MKKICFVTTIPATIKAFILDTAKYLHESGGYDITVICDKDEEFTKLMPQYIKYKPVSMKRGISFDGLKAIVKMYFIFKAGNFDIVQYSTPNASLYASIASKLAGIPVRLYCQWGIVYVGFTGIKRKLFKAIEKVVCYFSTWIEPDSFGNLEFSYMEGLYSSKKSSVVWNGSASGINLQKFNINHKETWRKEIRSKFKINDSTFVLGFVGRITRDKGINELFLACTNYFKENSNAVLMMIGDKESTDSVNKELYQWSRDNERVFYCGRTPEVEKYLSAFDVFILPSYREGFGSVVIEAEVMGVPVIVTDIPGPTDAMIENQTGLVVKKGDADSLLQAIRELEINPELRNKMGSIGVGFAKEKFEQYELFKYILVDRDKLTNNACRTEELDMDNLKPKVSIIMGIYNCESTLTESIDSILAQTYERWELIMCDDGSKDKTYDIARGFVNDYPSKFVLLKNEKNMGLNYTLNICLEKASGGYIARMDGDDISLPTRLQEQVDILDNKQNISIVSSAMIYFDETGDWGVGRPKQTPQMQDFISGTPFAHAPCMVRKEAYKAVRGYTVDKRLLRVEDYHLWIKMYAKGYRGYNFQEPLYKMRDDQNALHRRNFKGRLNEVYVKYLAIKMLKLPLWYSLFIFKPIIVGLLPSNLYLFLHKKRLK